MPTTLQRTNITHTAQVQENLKIAARLWPELNTPRALLLRLLDEGARAAYEQELEKQYADAYDEWYRSEDAELWDATSGDGIDEK